MKKIYAATEDELLDPSVDLVVIDVGFSAKNKSCGLLVSDADTRADCECTFGDLTRRLCDLAAVGSAPINLILEAPLSVAFKNGKPC